MDEGELSYPPSFNARIWLADLDADACPEIYFCGDMASDDYVLNVWSCKSGTPELIPFEDQLFLKASILSISEGSLQLESTQDVLGSYEAVRAYVLHDGVLVPLGDAWQIVPANTSYSRLSLVRDLPVTLDDGTESTFGPGTILQVTGTDGKSFVDVITEDGVTGPHRHHAARGRLAVVYQRRTRAGIFRARPLRRISLLQVSGFSGIMKKGAAASRSTLLISLVSVSGLCWLIGWLCKKADRLPSHPPFRFKFDTLVSFCIYYTLFCNHFKASDLKNL